MSSYYYICVPQNKTNLWGGCSSSTTRRLISWKHTFRQVATKLPLRMQMQAYEVTLSYEHVRDEGAPGPPES